MKTKFTFFASAIVLLMAVSCNSFKKDETKELLSEQETTDKYNQIKEMDWLIGEWQSHSSSNNTTEVWKKADDSTFVGYGYTLKDRDTISFEDIVLDQRGDSLHYIVTTRYQNDAKPVSFTLKSFTANKYIFENLKHDFPTRITYHKISEDSIKAEISGISNGETAIVEFPMVRKK
jgi:hypothetical protein